MRLLVAGVTLAVIAVFGVTGYVVGTYMGHPRVAALSGVLVSFVVTQPFLLFLLFRRMARVPPERKVDLFKQ